MTPLDSYTNFNSISALSRSYIEDIGRWMRLVAITYFVFLVMGALGIVGGLLFSSGFSEELAAEGIPPGALVAGGIVMLIFIVFSFYIAWVMLKTANGFRAYAANGSPAMLEQGFVNNKTYWLIMGIFTIIGFILMVIIGIVAAIYLPDILSGLDLSEFE